MASIDRRPDGRWRARWREYPGGPQRARHFSKKADAERHLVQVHAAGPFVGHPFTCDHPSASGVDDAPFGDTKVWRCDVCGVLYRSVRVEGSLRRIAPIEADQ